MKWTGHSGKKWSIGIGAMVGALALMVLVPLSAIADDATDAKTLVDRAKLTVESFSTDKNLGEPVRDLLKKAKGVYIAPQVLRGAFVVGASGGSGVLLVRGDKGRWNGPAFYTIGEASFGLQIGGDSSEVMLLIMSDRGVSSLLGASVKLGADASVAAGKVGAGAAAETANLSADIITFARSKGAYAGASLEGAVVAKRDGLNEAYYGKKEVTPTDILIKGAPTSQQAAPLKTSLNKLAAGK